jgi:hypothetical protein
VSLAELAGSIVWCADGRCEGAREVSGTVYTGGSLGTPSCTNPVPARRGVDRDAANKKRGKAAAQDLKIVEITVGPNLRCGAWEADLTGVQGFVVEGEKGNRQPMLSPCCNMEGPNKHLSEGPFDRTLFFLLAGSQKQHGVCHTLAGRIFQGFPIISTEIADTNSTFPRRPE